MKFAYLASGLLAALISAQPILEQEDYASGNVTGELDPHLVSGPLTGRPLVKRSNVIFGVFSSSNCGGGGTTITRDGSGTKGHFSPPQHSVTIDQLTNGWHLTLYSGLKQSGVLTRFFATEVGDQCYTGSWQSYGLYRS